MHGCIRCRTTRIMYASIYTTSIVKEGHDSRENAKYMRYVSHDEGIRIQYPSAASIRRSRAWLGPDRFQWWFTGEMTFAVVASCHRNLTRTWGTQLQMRKIRACGSRRQVEKRSVPIGGLRGSVKTSMHSVGPCQIIDKELGRGFPNGCNVSLKQQLETGNLTHKDSRG